MITIKYKTDLLALGFHEEGQLAHNPGIEVVRTIGGWIYIISRHGQLNTLFVPEKYEGGTL